MKCSSPGLREGRPPAPHLPTPSSNEGCCRQAREEPVSRAGRGVCTPQLPHLHKPHVCIHLQHVILTSPQLLCQAACRTRPRGSAVVAAHLTHLRSQSIKQASHTVARFARAQTLSGHHLPGDKVRYLLYVTWVSPPTIICPGLLSAIPDPESVASQHLCSSHSRGTLLTRSLTCLWNAAVLLAPASLTKPASASGSTCHTTPTNTRSGCAACRNKSRSVH